jgi:hypothetical protein
MGGTAVARTVPASPATGRSNRPKQIQRTKVVLLSLRKVSERHEGRGRYGPRDQSGIQANLRSNATVPPRMKAARAIELTKKLTPAQEAVLQKVEENPGCKPEGREAEQLRRFGLVELDTPTTTSLIGYRITEAGRDYLDGH